jgi:hypothetical protein
MAEKLKVDAGETTIGKKIVDIHQKNEYTHVNDYKEGMCFGCFGNGIPVGAGVVDICGDCAGKKGRETILVPIKEVYYGMCYFCGDYKFHMEQINARLCQKCHRRVANVMKEYNRKGGMFAVDPFWKNMRKKHGKDWQIIMSKGLGNKR